MRIIAIANQKGGVGKTTTTVNLGAALAAAGKKVILMDLDPQAHLTTYLGIAAEEMEHSSYELLSQSVDLGGSLRSVRENLYLLPANLNLAAAEQELVSVLGREVILRDAIEAYAEACDYILIDCPPSLGLLTLNALCAAKELFIPLQPHFLSLQGLSQLLETVLLVNQRINPELRLSGLLFCMYDSRTSLSGEIVGDIQSFFAKQSQMENPWKDVRIFETRIRGNIKLAESPSYGQTILEYAPSCHGAEDYRALAGEVEEMYGESKPEGKTDETIESVSADEISRGARPHPTEAEPISELETELESAEETEAQLEITEAEKAALTESAEPDERPETLRVAPASAVEETAPIESTVEQAKEVHSEGI